MDAYRNSGSGSPHWVAMQPESGGMDRDIDYAGSVHIGGVRPLVVLRRTAHVPGQGMFGMLLIPRKTLLLPFCLTLEDPWRNNTRNMSCVPAGEYEANRWVSPRFSETFLMSAIPGRSRILFHWGNSHLDTEGCILLAESFDRAWDDQVMVLSSRPTFTRFMAAMAGIDRFMLRIEDAWGGTTRVLQ